LKPFGAGNEDWIKHTAAIPQPALLIRGTDAFGLQGIPPIVSDNEAKKTVQRMANCRYR
jgi:hypothetical protein